MACLAAVGMTASATDYTDVLTLDEAQFAAALAGQEVTGYFTAGSPDFTWEGGSTDIEYRVSGICDDEQGGMQFYYEKGFIASLTNPNGLYLKSVKLIKEIYGSAYGRNTPVEYHQDIDGYDVPNVGWNSTDYEYYPGNTSLEMDWNNYGYLQAEEPFTYVVIQPGSGSYYNIEAIEITWTDVVPMPQVKTPQIRIDADWNTGAMPSGTIAYMQDPTDGCTIHYTVSINGGDPVEFTGEEGVNSVEYELVGEAGTEFSFVCWAVKEGYVDSEKVEAKATLTLPGLKAPEGSVGRWADFECVLGQTGVITNPNGHGTLVYNINETGDQETLEPEVSFIVEGEIGSPFSVTAYVKEEGYNNSTVSSINSEVHTNILNAPYFDPEDGTELRAGQAVSVKSNQRWMISGFRYRVNGGEWQTTDEYDVTILPEGDVTIEAQCLPKTEGTEYTYYFESEIASASFTVEQLTESMISITPKDFAEGSMADHSELTAVIGGITWEMKSGISWQGYFDWGYYSDDHITNLDPVEPGIQAVKINVRPDVYNDDQMIYFSDSPLADSDMNLYGDSEADADSRLFIKSSEDNNWINLKEYDEANGTQLAGKKYMLIRPAHSDCWSQMTRIVIDTDVNTAVEGVAAETFQADGVYDLNGVAVKSDRLAKGIYINVAGGKASKMIVK